MKGHIELRLDVGVTLEAELRLRGSQQLIRNRAGVYAVAGQAAYVGIAMGRALKVGVLPLVAAKALLIHLLCRGLGGIEDLRCIAAALRVRLAGTVTAFTGDACAAMLLSQPAVRVLRKFLSDLFVAACAGVCSHKVTRSGLGFSLFYSLGRCGCRLSAEEDYAQGQRDTDSQ